MERLRTELDETRLILYKRAGLVRETGPITEEEVTLQRAIGGVRPFSEVSRRIKMKIHKRMKEREAK